MVQLVGSIGWFNWLVHVVAPHRFNWLVHVVGSIGWFMWLLQVDSVAWFNQLVPLVGSISWFCGWCMRLVQLVGLCDCSALI